jgi:hypothetical protein
VLRYCTERLRCRGDRGKLTGAEHIAGERERDKRDCEWPEAVAVAEMAALVLGELNYKNTASKSKGSKENDEWYGDFCPTTIVDGPCAEHLISALSRHLYVNLINVRAHHHQARFVSQK